MRLPRFHMPPRLRAQFEHGHQIVGPLRLKIANWIARFPVLLGMTVALTIATTALILVIGEQKRLDRALTTITHERIDTTASFCDRINLNADAVNRGNSYIAALIVQGAKSSEPFEPIYRQYGFPPFEKRLRLARRQGRKVTALSVPPLGCASLEQQIRAELHFR
jgi:hypothetical protein